MNFLQLANDVRALVNAAEDGELTEPLEKALAATSGAFEDKHDAIRAVMNELEGRAERRKAEAERIAELARRAFTAHDRLYEWLKAGMRAADVKRIETDQFITTLAKNGGKPAVKYAGDAEALPERFRKSKTEYSVDRDEVLAAHKAGEALPEGVTVERGERLVLK